VVWQGKMTGLMEWLLALKHVHPGEGDSAVLRFATPPAPWIMLVGALLAAAVIHYVYRREALPAPRRWALFGLRWAVMMLVLFILGQPQLVVRRNLVDPSRVVVLVDRSASMSLRDVPSAGGGDTRWAQAVSSLTDPASGLLARLDPAQEISVQSFADAVTRVGSLKRGDDPTMLKDRLSAVRPDGPASDLAGALRAALNEESGRRLAGIVLISDGRRTTPESLAPLVAQARARSVPVHTVGVGSGRPLRDVRIESAWCEEEVFVQDAVVVRVRVGAAGYAPAAACELELVDESSGEPLAAKTLQLDARAGPAEVELPYRPARAGRRMLRVRARATAGDENPENDSAQLMVRAHDEKISVLYVESHPRFEYRYLKNLLLREPTIESSCLLLGASARFPQEGTRPIRQFPQSIEELRQYDVIILGDVDPHAEWISPTQLSLLADCVSMGGAGLAVIAGERNMPQRLRNTPLERLLPVRLAGTALDGREPAHVQPFTPALTPEGRASGIFMFDTTNFAPSPEMLPGWFWCAEVLGAQPAASVLSVHPTAGSNEGPLPLVVLGRAGAARTFYVGTDDVWRWRKYAGDHYYDAFWMQAIRTLARGRKLGQKSPWRLETDRRRYDLGEQVNVRLSSLESGATHELDSVKAQVCDVYRGIVDRISLSPAGPPGVFDGAFVPPHAGGFVITALVPESAADQKSPSCDIRVAAMSAEWREPEADHEFLKALAAQTGGIFTRATEDSSLLARSIPDRSIVLVDDLEEPIWDKPIMLVLLSFLLASEWIARKAWGLA